jgi:hypothetical protein
MVPEEEAMEGFKNIPRSCRSKQKAYSTIKLNHFVKYCKSMLSEKSTKKASAKKAGVGRDVWTMVWR